MSEVKWMEKGKYGWLSGGGGNVAGVVMEGVSVQVIRCKWRGESGERHRYT